MADSVEINSDKVKRFDERMANGIKVAPIKVLPSEKYSILDQDHFPSLDGFRAISIIMVIISHLYFSDHAKNLGLRIFNGLFGVSVFFVISGFLITSLLLKEREKNGFISLRKFYIRRALRIFPVAYLYLLILALLTLVFNLKVGIWSFLGSIFYFRNIDLHSMPDFQTGHFWSLSAEEQFYLLFPFILKKNLRIYTLVVMGLILAIPVMVHGRVYHFFIFRLGFFDILAQLFMSSSPILIGSLTAVLLYKNKLGRMLHFVDSLLLNLMLFVLAALICSGFIPYLPSVLYPAISAVFIMALILNNLKTGKNLFYRLLNSKALVQIGILSYSLYVWQQLFTHDQPWKNLFPGSDSILLNLTVLFLVSWLSYNFYEKKFLTLKARFK